MEVPVFSDDSTEYDLDGEVKGAIKWEKRDGEYVFLWYQEPFRIANNNGGYSMSVSLLEQIPEHIESVWVVDSGNKVVRRFDLKQWRSVDDAREVIMPSDARFASVKPERQMSVDIKAYKESHPLGDVESLIKDTK